MSDSSWETPRPGLRPPLFRAGQSPGGPVFVRAGEVGGQALDEPGLGCWAVLLSCRMVGMNVRLG
jgi:hypothetical protein